jgi:hypothetical protein
MPLPDDPAETGKRRALGTADADDAANLILPEEFSAGRAAQFARVHVVKIARRPTSPLRYQPRNRR